MELRPPHRAYALSPVSTNAAGEFSFGEIASGRYDVLVSELPEDVYVAGIYYGDTAVDVPQVTMTGEPKAFAIMVNAGGARIDGTVQNANRQTVANVQVVLIPDRPLLRAFASSYKEAITDDAGRFALRGIPSGDYKLFAWDSIPETAYMNPAVIGAYESRGQPVRAEGGQTVKAAINLIAR